MKDRIIVTSAEREFIEAHKAFVRAMQTFEGPSDAQIERLKLAIAAESGVSLDRVVMGISGARVIPA